MVEGSTANTTLVRELLVDLRDRGLDVTRPMLVVIDGAKALRRAVREVFDHPVIQRGQQHQIQNVKDKLPERLRGVVERRMRAAYRAASAVDAEAPLEALAGELAKTHPGAAGSLRAGIEETLTVIRLGLPPTLAHTMHSTSRVRGSIRYTERLEEAGAVTSVGSRGDSYDHALAESLIGLYKANWCSGRDRGAGSTAWSWRRWSGSTGSTTAASSARSATSRPPSTRPASTARPSRPRRDSMNGAVQ